MAFRSRGVVPESLIAVRSHRRCRTQRPGSSADSLLDSTSHLLAGVWLPSPEHRNQGLSIPTVQGSITCSGPLPGETCPLPSRHLAGAHG